MKREGPRPDTPDAPLPGRRTNVRRGSHIKSGATVRSATSVRVGRLWHLGVPLDGDDGRARVVWHAESTTPTAGVDAVVYSLQSHANGTRPRLRSGARTRRLRCSFLRLNPASTALLARGCSSPGTPQEPARVRACIQQSRPAHA